MPEGLRADMITKGMSFSYNFFMAVSVGGVILYSGFNKVPSISLKTIVFIWYNLIFRFGLVLYMAITILSYL